MDLVNENDMPVVLLCTVKKGQGIGQALETYALYKVIAEFDMVPVIWNVETSTEIRKYYSKYCNFSSQVYENQIQAAVTGTNQIWSYEPEHDYNALFLNNGMDDIVRVAYAPSFGRMEEWPLGPKNAAYFMLKKLDHVAAVDKNTLGILNLEFGCYAEQVCNPILLLDQYDHSGNERVGGLFIAAHLEQRDYQKNRILEMAEEVLRYQIRDISKDVADSHISLDDYIGTIEKASLVITDSVETMHLSIALGKPFIVAASKTKRCLAEYFDTLEKLDLTERLVYIEDDVYEKKFLCRKPIRYKHVEQKKNEWRKDSVKWLHDAILS